MRWSADRTQAWRLQAGEVGDPLSVDEAAAEAARMGLPVPEVRHTRAPSRVALWNIPLAPEVRLCTRDNVSIEGSIGEPLSKSDGKLLWASLWFI